jgi:hypothetical protein
MSETEDDRSSGERWESTEEDENEPEDQVIVIPGRSGLGHLAERVCERHGKPSRRAGSRLLLPKIISSPSSSGLFPLPVDATMRLFRRKADKEKASDAEIKSEKTSFLRRPASQSCESVFVSTNGQLISLADTAFKQQRLKAWQPILTPKSVLPTFFVIGVIFAPIGGVLLWGSNQVCTAISIYPLGR